MKSISPRSIFDKDTKWRVALGEWLARRRAGGCCPRRLVERGLHDELKGSAYAIVEGIDGRTHHMRFTDIEMTGDATPGAIVEARTYDDAQGRKHLTLATRSDLSIEAQVTAQGATWIDRQLIARDSEISSTGFGIAARDAMERRIDHLVSEGLARRQGQRVIFARDLLNTLRQLTLMPLPQGSPPRPGCFIVLYLRGACGWYLSSTPSAGVGPVCHD